LPPSSSDLVERKSVVPPCPPADRRREHRGRGSRLEAAYFVGPSPTKKRVGSLLLSTAARDPGFRLSSLIQYMRTADRL